MINKSKTSYSTRKSRRYDKLSEFEFTAKRELFVVATSHNFPSIPSFPVASRNYPSFPVASRISSFRDSTFRRCKKRREDIIGRTL
jgi:hypothetical protein